jgi:hypothetical protein
MLISLNERDKQLYDKLYVARLDIAFARQCAETILKKGWHYKPWEKRGSIYFQQSAFMTALVVSYARAFTPSTGWRRLPKGLPGYNREEDALHKRLLALRNSVYAHSASESYSVRPWRSGSFSTDIVGQPFLMLSRDDTMLFVNMTQKAISAIDAKRKNLL